jgi:acetylglutamate kinase
MQKLIEKAKVLIESLPYIQQFAGETVVVKYGGHAMVDETLKKSFALDIILMKHIGINPVVVHGGGPQIGEVMKKMGMEPRFVDGYRVTDSETMSVVEMVLVGKVNKEIVSLINTQGGRAVGLGGKDGGLICGKKKRLKRQDQQDQPPEIIDIGMVGDVEKINPEILDTLDDGGFIPVIAPVGVGPDGETYNINADLVASKIAEALTAAKLVLLTDVEGVKNKDGKLITSMTRKKINESIKNGTIKGGMIPKVQCCLEALGWGVNKTHIIDGRVEHALLLEIFTDKGIGTQITE